MICSIVSTNYELLLVARTGLSDAIFTKTQKIIKDVGALNVATERLGKKTLAYPVAKQTEGEYLIFNFEAQGEAVNQLASALRLEQGTILRYLITKTRAAKVSPSFTTSVAKASEVKKVSEGKKVSGKEKKAAKVTVRTKTRKPATTEVTEKKRRSLKKTKETVVARKGKKSKTGSK